ncbi:MAG: hypothetical protein Dbin4_00377 [Alphaproteobacteria bacterium]|nr:hypothetical protein [Alphaproteobacteria bacterium]
MNEATYYRDHWVEVEPERLNAYTEMFKWRPEMEPLLAAADLKPGQTVVDYGCGPGGLALELARRAGPSGHVHGVDLNAEFAGLARKALAEAGFGAASTVHHVMDDKIPLPGGSVDRLICKNVMEYVPDIDATLAEFRRVVKPGGIAHIIDSDWGMLVVEPLGQAKLNELFEAAKLAYHTPHAGRILYSRMKKAGFPNVSVKILANPDIKGQMLMVLHNMANYARIGGRIDPRRADALLAEVKQSIAEGSYMMVLPQFLVTATG